MSLGCNSCHGGGGGGGMAAPLTNQIWIYGNDDDTLFRLIALGTVEFQKQGYTRKRLRGRSRADPPFGQTIKTDDDLWKIIAWMRSVHCSRLVGGCRRLLCRFFLSLLTEFPQKREFADGGGQ
jgi:mono/diheme cytochrome c family protein